MANTTIASNSTERGNIWLPYNHKPFILGETGNKSSNSTDGKTYITQTTGTSDLAIRAVMIDEFNCNYKYTITFTTNSGSDDFIVRKYNKVSNNLVDIIYASETGISDTGRFWNPTSSPITIDIGLIIKLPSTTGFANGDVYTITTPDKSVMKKRRLYHGGYSTYMRLPETEGITTRSKIIPTDLMHRNITCLAGLENPFTWGGSALPLLATTSHEDAIGNRALSFTMEWNVDPYGAESSTAQDTGYVPTAGETWQVGTALCYDIDSADHVVLPILSQAPASDTTQASNDSNDNATTISGRAGHARIRADFMTGTGSPVMMCHNQWWPITIILG